MQPTAVIDLTDTAEETAEDTTTVIGSGSKVPAPLAGSKRAAEPQAKRHEQGASPSPQAPASRRRRTASPNPRTRPIHTYFSPPKAARQGTSPQRSDPCPAPEGTSAAQPSQNPPQPSSAHRDSTAANAPVSSAQPAGELAAAAAAAAAVPVQGKPGGESGRLHASGSARGTSGLAPGAAQQQATELAAQLRQEEGELSEAEKVRR